MSSTNEGKFAARNNGDQSKIVVDNKDESRLAEFYMNFFVVGYSVALVVLMCELLDSFVHRIMRRCLKRSVQMDNAQFAISVAAMIMISKLRFMATVTRK